MCRPKFLAVIVLEVALVLGAVMLAAQLAFALRGIEVPAQFRDQTRIVTPLDNAPRSHSTHYLSQVTCHYLEQLPF